MTGLINRLIWVWPKWDVENHEEIYTNIPVRLGWFYDENEADNRSFCMCATLNQTYICRSMTDFGMGKDDNGFDMPIDQCRIKRTLIFEEVAEPYAVKYFREKFSLDDPGHVLLDIDEDYYGCTYAVMPLLNANVSLKSVKQINKRASALFCPKTTKQDHNTDRLLFILIDLLRQYKKCSTDKTLTHPAPCKNLTDQYIRSYFASELIRKNGSSFINICRLTFTTLPKIITSILKVLNKLSSRQLETLQEVGFCSFTSPKTYLNEDGFTICMGANTPARTAVLVHSPTVSENRKRSRTLQTILNSIPNFLPKVITVARSVRDGYTPKVYFEDIEKDVLSILKSRFNDISIHYDMDLLGGVNGWPARRRALVQEIEQYQHSS